jgi:LmbE family N-acetylglucosaminyl deacetylase
MGEDPPVGWLFISPHLDDAVLSCGALLSAMPGSLVATVFAGTPAPAPTLTEWDGQLCEIAPGTDVMAVRRDEDRRALSVLGAGQRLLGLLDGQYDGSDRSGGVLTELRALLHEVRPAACVVPMGIVHPDHELVRQQALELAREDASVRWVVYEDLPYAGATHRNTDAPRAAIARAGFSLRPSDLGGGGGTATKLQAVGCYETQLVALRKLFDLPADVESETYWELAPA